jgi:hypothetical protein
MLEEIDAKAISLKAAFYRKAMAFDQKRLDFPILLALYLALQRLITTAGFIVAIGAILTSLIAFAHQFAQPFFTLAQLFTALFIGFGLASGQDIGGFGHNLYRRSDHFLYDGRDTAAEK